jgi:ATP-dependent DNA helicase RecQ
LQAPPMPSWMPTSQLLRVRYRPESYRRTTPSDLLDEWRIWLTALLRRKQIQAIRASHTVLAELYQDDSWESLPFWCALEPQDPGGCWVELVLLMPAETHLPQSDYDPCPRVIVAPEGLPDPFLPHRTWWDCHPGSRELESFRQEFE